MFGILDQLIAYEMGEIEEEDTFDLFQNLVDTGLVWLLQGHYGRTAIQLLEEGWIMPPEQPKDPLDKLWGKD